MFPICSHQFSPMFFRVSNLLPKVFPMVPHLLSHMVWAMVEPACM
jgi:hypothetical protein